jgi:hypothetical protein
LDLWHLLSLDAPSVAALWTYFLARSVGLHLPWTAPVAMFVAVWMIYAADRLLDARALDTSTNRFFLDPHAKSVISTDQRERRDPCILSAQSINSTIGKDSQAHSSPHDLEERHRFHHRHRNRFLAVLAVAAASLVYLLPRINPRALLLYSLLATMLATWLLIIHARSHSGTRRLPKELAVGIFFPAAVFIPTVARLPQLQLALLPAAVLFAAVCTLNCLFLYAWEHPQPLTTSRHAHWTTLYAVRHLPQLATLIITASLLTASLDSNIRLPALACTLSATLLLLLHTRRHHILPVTLRAAADAVLLTPLLLLPWLPSSSHIPSLPK